MESGLRLLFVCSGNITRSPMAAGIADTVALEFSLDVEIRSAGTLGLVDVPADPKAVAVCREIGVDLEAHRSRPLTAELVAWATHVLVMEDQHAAAARELRPDLRGRVVHLGPIAGFGAIADPTGSWFKGPYRACRDDLRGALRRVLPSLKDAD